MMVNVANAIVAASIKFEHDGRRREEFYKHYYLAEVRCQLCYHFYCVAVKINIGFLLYFLLWLWFDYFWPMSVCMLKKVYGLYNIRYDVQNSMKLHSLLCCTFHDVYGNSILASMGWNYIKKLKSKDAYYEKAVSILVLITQ